MKSDNLKKVNYGSRNMILNFVIAGLLIIIIALIISGVKDLTKTHIYDEKSFSTALSQGNYTQVLSMYESDYDPSKSYSDSMMECYACAEYYYHASLYSAALAAADTDTVAIEQRLMDEVYNRMGQYKKYAKDMLDSVKKEDRT